MQFQRKAFFINVYNSLTIHAMVRQTQLYKFTTNPKEVSGFFDKHCYCIGGHIYSLDDIEHGALRDNTGHPSSERPRFDEGDPRIRAVCSPLDPRLHFALNCGARSCPPIRVYLEER